MTTTKTPTYIIAAARSLPQYVEHFRRIVISINAVSLYISVIETNPDIFSANPVPDLYLAARFNALFLYTHIVMRVIADTVTVHAAKKMVRHMHHHIKSSCNSTRCLRVVTTV